ncbi:MAG TPA: dihydrolipoamide acetyltransferase family protein [Jatrophihabitans sp.]|jgi:pyruvate dehydrogenase E2 component (dihydrolipoamide acetyltransferase)|uniref:dihydrolipoamide acetyltransferase family protein n=1 Tax=Jatrophihabitans sp. TaxID=1932789 RepID=UPI002EE140B5
MPDFLLPDLGEGLTDAEILTWLVAVGDQVSVDQPVVEVETAKASVEVPIPFAGKVSALFGDPGQRIAVGSPLITVEEVSAAASNGVSPSNSTNASNGTSASNGAAESAAAESGATEQVAVESGATEQVAVESSAAESSEYSGNVLIGYGTSSAPARRRGRAGRRAASAGLPQAVAATSTPATAGGRRLVATSVISPVVRKLARDRGIDLAVIRPSDPSGVIRRCDIEAFSSAPGSQPQATAATADSPAPSHAGTAGVERVPLTGLRRVMADKLSLSRREIPEATVWVDVDATGLLEARQALNAARPDEPVSVLALLSRFCVLGLVRYRELNSRITDDAVEILPDVNLGFAAQTPRGLLVPVLPRAQTLTTRQLSAALTERTEAARAGSLTPAQLTGGTFTVNNYGVFGVDGSAAIINHPEVAILGLGRIIDRPWVHDGALAIRKVSQLTLAFDHRACDGGVAGGFLRFVADCIENPVTALGEL